MVATHSVVPCGHMFCGECLSQWLQKNPSCPKCRAAATGWVQTIAVDNVLESLVEKTMTPQELQERKQRKKSWEAKSVQINNRMKNVFRGSAPPMHGMHGPRYGGRDPQVAAEAFQAAMSGMPGFAGKLADRTVDLLLQFVANSTRVQVYASSQMCFSFAQPDCTIPCQRQIATANAPDDFTTCCRLAQIERHISLCIYTTWAMW